MAQGWLHLIFLYFSFCISISTDSPMPLGFYFLLLLCDSTRHGILKCAVNSCTDPGQTSRQTWPKSVFTLNRPKSSPAKCVMYITVMQLMTRHIHGLFYTTRDVNINKMPQTERENRDPGRRYLEREFKIASVASLEPRYFEVFPSPGTT